FGRLAASPRLFRASGALLRAGLRALPASLLARLTPSWSRARALPAPPPRSFRAELKRRHPGRLL
ncbi:MAG: 4Fe-4S ferredoxin, partial [Candidatus Krumholzibacteriota bacterium]|nr:4Fe-4S ferredoxin [Candidatus Krumholzibacteriota bacterium]